MSSRPLFTASETTRGRDGPTEILGVGHPAVQIGDNLVHLDPGRNTRISFHPSTDIPSFDISTGDMYLIRESQTHPRSWEFVGSSQIATFPDVSEEHEFVGEELILI